MPDLVPGFSSQELELIKSLNSKSAIEPLRLAQQTLKAVLGGFFRLTLSPEIHEIVGVTSKGYSTRVYYPAGEYSHGAVISFSGVYSYEGVEESQFPWIRKIKEQRQSQLEQSAQTSPKCTEKPICLYCNEPIIGNPLRPGNPHYYCDREPGSF